MADIDITTPSAAGLKNAILSASNETLLSLNGIDQKQMVRNTEVGKKGADKSSTRSQIDNIHTGGGVEREILTVSISKCTS